MLFAGSDCLSIGTGRVIRGVARWASGLVGLSEARGFINIEIERRKTIGKCLLPLPFV